MAFFPENPKAVLGGVPRNFLKSQLRLAGSRIYVCGRRRIAGSRFVSSSITRPVASRRTTAFEPAGPCGTDSAPTTPDRGLRKCRRIVCNAHFIPADAGALPGERRPGGGWERIAFDTPTKAPEPAEGGGVVTAILDRVVKLWTLAGDVTGQVIDKLPELPSVETARQWLPTLPSLESARQWLPERVRGKADASD